VLDADHKYPEEDVNDACDRYLHEHDARHLEELGDFLRIPSVSSLPQHTDDVRCAATHSAAQLRSLGASGVELLPTAGNPIVYGEWPAPDLQAGTPAPTAILYGHYDVQPPDPLDLWTTPPFEPTAREGRLYARGAADDKGNMFAPLKAIEALLATAGRVPIGLKCLFEGEEEIGSPSLPEFVRANAARYQADFALCADGGMWGPDAPSLTIGSKGIAACQIDLRTASSDLHSGAHGAAVPNAVEALARLVTTMHDDDGRITIRDFYDPVRDLTPTERAEMTAIPFDAVEYQRELALPALWGEPEYTPLERRWARPTLDLNGIWGGFTGEGLKTVTPCEAHAKITCRLVPDQRPDAVLDLIEAHVREHCPPGATVSVRRFGGAARPFAVRPDHPALQAAGRVLRDLYGKEPLIIRTGGTLPLAETLQADLGADMIFFSWGMPGDNVHAPNESLLLDAFTAARRAYCALPPELAEAYAEAKA
jgi:acetylornithine deacetylase/succinyl-diaminopimelate desuccinylase-like protein